MSIREALGKLVLGQDLSRAEAHAAMRSLVEGEATPSQIAGFAVALRMKGETPEEIAGNRAFQLMTARPFPWSREVWALLLDRLFAAGARLIIFDFVFSPPNDGDPEFHARRRPPP